VINNVKAKKILPATLILCLLCALAAGCSGSTGSVEGVDVDFVRMGATVAQVEFYYLLASSGDYIGKTIRASGEYFSMFIPDYGREFHYVTVVVGDAFCCPSEGFEIRFNQGSASYGHFPAQNTMIEVVGVLGRYDEFGQGFLYLAIDEIIILS